MSVGTEPIGGPNDHDLDGPSPSRTYYEGIVRIPGYGEQPERCQYLKPIGFCREAGHVHLAAANPCQTRYCPDHWGGWRRKALEGMIFRLAAFRQAQSGKYGKRLLHVVASPDQDLYWEPPTFWKKRTESYDAVESVGGRGGVAVAHPYRSSDEGDELFNTVVEHGDWSRERGKWTFFRDSSDTWDDLQPLLEAAPHYHHLAAVEDFDPDAVPTGWVVKNVRSLPPFHIDELESYESMVEVAAYLLSHAADQRGRQTSTYWGDLHPSRFDPEEALSDEEYGTIEAMVGRALSVTREEGEAELGELECSHDDCEGTIVPLGELEDYLQDDEWLGSIDWEQRLRLRGVYQWVVMGDRPPPHHTVEERAILDWLEQRGRLYYVEHQGGLGVFGAGSPHLVG